MSANTIVPLPGDVTRLLDGFLAGVHPGLALDKYALSWDASGITKGLSERVQRPAVDQVVRLSNSPPMPPREYDGLFQRWQATVGKHAFTGTTAGPLTLHLARASALENAGICFHRVYGFVYLPGSGLKGLARAFACEVWLGEQKDRAAAWKLICDVFGTAPSPWLNDLSKRHEQPVPKEAVGGAVVFHDAWPERWPKLVTDILNSHHKNYYEEKGPPGDWEDPVPVYFLSVETGTPFRFAVAPRRGDTDPELVTLAQQWLIGGLTQLGAGAKTASGYGDFTVDEPKVTPIVSVKRPSFTATLELVTPAFLAGAKQQADDCDLRPSTLRGQLRWWWRTMHAGFVTVEELRKMEAAIWGDTKQGGVVRVTVRRTGGSPPRLYSHPQQKRGDPPSGTRYAAYGMDEQVKVDGVKVRKQRHVLEPGARWQVKVSVQVPGPRAADAVGVLKQATAALWLLTQFGGVGSKSRKGFGSLQAAPLATDNWPTSLDDCKGWATAYRNRPNATFDTNTAHPGSLFDPDLQRTEVEAGATNPWVVVERVGAAYSAVCGTFQHDGRKAAFGLPRKIHGPLPYPLPHQYPDTHQQPLSLTSPVWPPRTNADKGRHTSPIHLHVGKGVGGELEVRLLALPAQFLRSRAESVAMLGLFVCEFQIEFANLGTSATIRGAAPPPPPQVPAKRTAGTPVQVTILQKRAKGGFDVQEVGRPAGTLTLGSPPAGVDTTDGATVTVWVHNDDPAKPQYKWPDRPRSGKK